MPERSRHIQGLRILVVEDEAVVAEGMRERLTRLGCQVTGVVDTGERAIETAAAEHPDLVLMDIRLRGKLDGIEAGATIRGQLDIPVVYLTAHSDQATLTRAIAAHPSGYLIKPHREAELVLALEIAIDQHRAIVDLRDSAEGHRGELVESETRFRDLIDDLEVGVVLQDAEDRILLSNPAAQRILGSPQEDLDGNSSRDPRWQLIRSDGTPLPLDEVPSVVASRRREPVRNRLIGSRSLATGERVWLLVTALPRLRADGSLRHVLVTIVDVTAQRQLEERLAQGQRLQAVGRLAGGVAHDFNNLCMIAQNSCDLIMADVTAHRVPAAEHVEAILDATQRASNLTSQLLDFSRRAALDPQPIELAAILSSQHALLGRLMPPGIELVLKGSVTPLWIRADRSQIERVLMNLCLNARDAMPDGGRIEIRWWKGRPSRPLFALEPPPAGYELACIEVRDSGSGIDPALLGEIFEPFFTTKGTGRGTGLGLATVQSVVAESEGYLELESEVGRGSSFRVYLPLTDPGVPAPEISERTNGAISGRVLLVEDEAALRRVLRKALERATLEVVEAGDGREALEQWARWGASIDLLVTDVVMPEMGGRELASALRGKTPGLRVIFMTGYEEATAGASRDLVLRKPFRAAELVARAVEVLARPVAVA